MSRLILHSDDLGLHAEVNRAIFTAADEGLLSSASLMVNGAAVDDAAARARRAPGLGIGLHLNIVRGRPLSPVGDVPTLVDRDGRFLNAMPALLWRSARGALSSDEIYREYRRQYLRMREYGLEPTHFDGEKHSHLLLPQAAAAVQRLADEVGVRKIRVVAERALAATLRALGIRVRGRAAQRLKLGVLERRGRKARDAWSGLVSPDASFGIVMSGAGDPSCGSDLVHALVGLPSPRTIEWMFHLSFPAPLDGAAFRAEFGRFFLTDARVRELEYLRSAPVRRAIDAIRDDIISYRDL